MNLIVSCPGCGLRGRLPDNLLGLKTIVCPKCRTAVPVAELLNRASPVADDSFPIWVDGEFTTAALAQAPQAPAPSKAEEPVYAGDFMKEEAARFEQYVAARLGELHKKRRELAEAECKFEALTMQRKQELHRQQGALAATSDEVAKRERDLQAREAALQTREAELAARETKVSRSDQRAADLDRRAAELRVTLDQLEGRRAAVAEERSALERRAAELDRIELALHRRSAELDELDERLRQEQEEWEQSHERTR
ncbi:hypothetical protein R5W24_004999 [Gemmata sp. JC717]|uniref:hypothetical protein n=1 Tax=Gemmata algarum TaxID=2975278 RepID=UPI0021BB1753|nr:hypothetical protein [Gemmata algarum]MDY3555853.1 hypothetical protein [Gemmata algarum]